MNYSGNALLVVPNTSVPKQWSGDESGVTQGLLAGAAAPLAQDPNMTHPYCPPKGSIEKNLANYTEVCVCVPPPSPPRPPLAPESENVTQKHCLEYATNQEGGGGLTMRNPSHLGRCLRSRGAHSLFFTLYPVTGRLCKPRAQRTYPCQSACFQAAGSPCSS